MKNISTGRDAITIISTGVTIEGKLSSDGSVRIDGIIKGDVNAHGNITIGEHGEILGQIKGSTITLGGKVYGSINADEKIVLESKSMLKGDLITKILVIEEGSHFEGNSKMNLTAIKNEKIANLESLAK
ncbi:MAG TPA: polymer-forming cytoskeletal protein [Ignavibacteriaceae bacterium]|nr:polymer-forming cytoskeletal protein [Ignavibacteriaceae bacterium]